MQQPRRSSQRRWHRRSRRPTLEARRARQQRRQSDRQHPSRGRSGRIHGRVPRSGITTQRLFKGYLRIRGHDPDGILHAELVPRCSGQLRCATTGGISTAFLVPGDKLQKTGIAHQYLPHVRLCCLSVAHEPRAADTITCTGRAIPSTRTARRRETRRLVNVLCGVTLVTGAAHSLQDGDLLLQRSFNSAQSSRHTAVVSRLCRATVHRRAQADPTPHPRPR